ncbi:L-ribulose-5-phosphate 3-epimerase [Ereboglobus sp. PH5-5]|uniref:TIM barrel protein n=1 Tax=Ereboglobus sp. PH5-5 TaxID=2940529 RepID=UPI002405A2C0|nr:TIM barrel protein [Ereboglobus sp. PH5-5]MDF9832146.1 L-ribulose-5-phosphate 3-epimerase [Ereboglobus sp. PH5-5]
MNLNRRTFLKSAAVLSAASLPLGGGGIFAQAAPAPSSPRPAGKFKKSIMWGTVKMNGSVLEKCTAIKAAGYEGIEPNSHMDRREVIDAAKATGLAISSVCCHTHWKKPLSHPDTAVRREGIEGMITALEDAAAYGTDAVLLVPGVVNAEVSYDDCWTRSVEGIKRLLPVAEKLKVQICIENVWNKFLLSPLEARRYVDQFDSPLVKFYFDVGNILDYGWPEQWIKILGERIARVHFKEFSKKIAGEQGARKGFKVPLGEGDVNWPEVMRALRGSYKNGWIATEQGSNKTPAELNDLHARFEKILRLR